MKTPQQILNKVSKEYKQSSFDYALKNCLQSYLHQIVETSMKEYANQFKSKVKLKIPSDKQLIDIAILFGQENGSVDKQKLADMVAMCEFILNRLSENNDVMKPASNEND